MTVADLASLVLTAAAAALASLRWLRVAQREHYLAGEATRFAIRWWSSGRDNQALALLAVAGAAASVAFGPAGLAAALATAAGPVRLGIRGRTSRVAWTRRLVTVAAVTALLELASVAVGSFAGGIGGAAAAVAFVAVLSPLFVDGALVLTRPLEELLARRFVDQARSKLERVRPLVVGITGSYGKTTVKGYVAHLLSPHRTTLASPRSFNNRAGLARTVNEMLGPATEVLIAEMGTYGPSEIAELCSWLRPEISVITAIGPAHLQRFKSLDVTLRSKAEITETARVVVLNVDDERLDGLATSLRSAGRKVVGASGSRPEADVAVIARRETLELYVGGRRVGAIGIGPSDQPSAPSNVACAAAVALELGVDETDVLARLASLPVPPNRLQRYVSQEGYVVFDDTFNSNPTGARLGLERLKDDPGLSPAGRRVVVTPGMVELGPIQASENAALGTAVGLVADYLVIVARTNRAALLAGAEQAATEVQVVTVDRLDQAVEWVRGHLGPGDAVLYENDLPDHYP